MSKPRPAKPVNDARSILEPHVTGIFNAIRGAELANEAARAHELCKERPCAGTLGALDSVAIHLRYLHRLADSIQNSLKLEPDGPIVQSAGTGKGGG